MFKKIPHLTVVLVLAGLLAVEPLQAARTITDAAGRTVQVPNSVDRVICSGPGCLRLLTYLQAQDTIVAVDDIETRRRSFDARPYALAHPEFKSMPIFGEFRGHDNPELIVALDPQPQVIFKTYPTMGHDPDELQSKTSIPVVVLNYGNLGELRPELERSLRIMARVVGRSHRAAEVISFFNSTINGLDQRTRDIAPEDRPSVFLGGVAFKGPHGYRSTEPGYPPFEFVNADNVARVSGPGGNIPRQADVAKEQIVAWDPDILFLDLATLQLGSGASGLHELKTDPAYQILTAVREGRVYGLLPYNWYTKNFGSVLANAFFIGKLLYPEQFEDIHPQGKADEIYEFLLGKPVFQDMNAMFANLAFQAIPLEEALAQKSFIADAL